MTESLPVALPAEAATLPSGGRMPLLGFGTWQLRGNDARTATAAALEVGYRHIDTATIYGNEREVGAALRDSGVAADDVFVTTKCPPERAGRALDTLRDSLDRLGLERVDLWLIHWSGDRSTNLSLWRSFVEAQQSGLATDIGVSNLSPSQIDDLTAETGVKPVVNQIKWSPLLFDRPLLEAHRDRDVVVEGYSGLRGGTLDHPVIRDVAAAVGRTPAQVIVRWHLQHRVVVIPRSRRPERIRANADVAGFELSAEQLAALDALGKRP